MMNAYAMDWLSLLGRWLHLITGIAWIGASFYFVWLDNHLVTPDDESLLRKGVGGELWAVHGGGFYNAQKYRVAPHTLPRSLHWFYWEAYSTLLSGLFLLVLLYYAQAEVYLIDPRVAALSKTVAIATSLAFLAGGWVVYDLLCRSALARHGGALSVALALLLGTAAYVLCNLFSGRGAFIQFGAMLGVIMVANVFFVIIPAQRGMVRAKQDGREPDARDAARGKLRSVHNTYFTLPVLFTMISNHYAMSFSGRYNWMVLIAMSVAGLLIRLYFVSRHRRHERGGNTSPWPVLAAIVILAATAAALVPSTDARTAVSPTVTAPTDPVAQFAAIQNIVTTRCVPCHAEIPSQPGFSVAPKGLVLDSPGAILSQVTVMEAQVQTRAMPIGNLTHMTDAERAQLLDWIHHGAAH